MFRGNWIWIIVIIVIKCTKLMYLSKFKFIFLHVIDAFDCQNNTILNLNLFRFYMAQGQSNTLEGEILAKLKVTDGLKLHNSRAGEMQYSSDSYESDSKSFESDSPCYRNAAKTLPSSTQKWTSTMLESLGICYNNDFHQSPTDILNMITKDTGIFGTSTEQQNLYVEGMKNSMTFDCSIQDFIEIMQKKNMFTVLDEEIANIKDLRYL